ncbi:glycosyltransferase [Campylobacter sp. US25a]|nr:glycosyltransferase [Campylobacter sp. US25a]
MDMLFSVIIPAYNSAATIGYTLDSIITQTYNNFEIIIVNDGSTDNLTLRICEKFKEIYSEYKVLIINKENGGLCSARNEGLKYVNGDIVLFLDSDDLLPLDTLKTYYDYFQDYDVDMIQGKMLNFSSTKRWKTDSYEKIIQNTHILNYNDSEASEVLSKCINPAGKAFKMSFIKKYKIHFLEGCMMTEDHYFTSLVYSKKPKVLLLNKYTFLYRRDNVNQSTNTWKDSYLDDIYKVQSRLCSIIDINNQDDYYKRFFNYEFKKFIIEPIIKLNVKNMYNYSSKILAILNTIPQKYKNKYILKSLAKAKTQQEVYTALKKINSKRIIKNIVNQFRILYRGFNKFFIYSFDLIYKKILKGHRIHFIVFLYNFLSFIVPIKKNKITFAIRPKDKLKFIKEIKEEALERNIFAVKTLLAKKIGLFEDFRIVYHLVRSKIIILDGHYWYLRGVKPRKCQEVVQVWHAAGLGKKFGLDMFEKDSKEYFEQLKHHSSYTYALASSDIAAKAYMSAFNLKEEQILKFGNIISDRIINSAMDQKQALEMLGLNKNKKLVVYAPTFRESNMGVADALFIPKIHFDKLASQFGDEYIFACRVHSNYKDVKLSENVINLSNEDEALVLSATSILITDYSSIMFNFLYFKRPIILYAYDYPIYMGQRNMYLEYNEYAPGIIAYNEKQLHDILKDINCIYNENKMENYWNFYMQYCNGNTAIKLIDFFEDIIIKK